MQVTPMPQNISINNNNISDVKNNDNSNTKQVFNKFKYLLQTAPIEQSSATPVLTPSTSQG